jgi:hypothetical protein
LQKCGCNGLTLKVYKLILSQKHLHDFGEDGMESTKVKAYKVVKENNYKCSREKRTIEAIANLAT